MSDLALGSDDIFRRVARVLSDVLFSGGGRWGQLQPRIELDTDIYKDLGMDSVETLDFLTALEEEFGVNPDQFEAAKKRTIAEIVEYVGELIQRRPSRDGVGESRS